MCFNNHQKFEKISVNAWQNLKIKAYMLRYAGIQYFCKVIKTFNKEKSLLSCY